jgi:hypothetical protein
MAVKFSSVRGYKPTAFQMVQQDILVNTADKVIYAKDTSGTIIQIGTTGGEVPTTPPVYTPPSSDVVIPPLPSYRGEHADTTTIILPLVSGDTYTNTTDGLYYVYDGSVWVGLVFSSDKYMLSLSNYTVSVSSDGLVFTPSAVVANLTKNGLDYNGVFKIYTNAQLTPDYISPAPEFTHTFNLAVGTTSVEFKVYESDGVTLLDTASTTVLEGGGEDGLSALTMIVENENHSIPCDADGTPIAGAYVGSGTILRVYEGTTELEYNTIAGNGRWSVTGSGSSITSGGIVDSGNYATAGDTSNITANLASITYTATGKRLNGTAFTLTKKQSFTKAKTGAEGIDGVTLTYSNDAMTIPVDVSGTETWTASASIASIVNGDAGPLTLASNTQTASYPASVNQYNIDIIKISGDTLTEPTITGAGGTTANIGVWAENLTQATLYRVTFYIKLATTSFQLYKDVSITPTFAGATGAPGTNGTDAYDVTVSNSNHSVPVSAFGSENWVGSGSAFSVKRGGVAYILSSSSLSSSFPTGLGSFNVNIQKVSGDNLTIPTPLLGGGTSNGGYNAWAGNLTSVTTYQIEFYVRATDNTTSIHYIVVTFSPTFAGADGAPGTNGTNGVRGTFTHPISIVLDNVVATTLPALSDANDAFAPVYGSTTPTKLNLNTVLYESLKDAYALSQINQTTAVSGDTFLVTWYNDATTPIVIGATTVVYTGVTQPVSSIGASQFLYDVQQYIDGDSIITGTLSAGKVTTGVLSAASGESTINLDTGDVNFGGKMIFNSTTNVLSVNGAITATSGTIGGWVIGSTLASVSGVVTLDGTNGIIKTGTATNYVQVDSTGIKGVSATLGTTFDIPSSGAAPTFSKGVIKETTYEMYTSGVIKTSATPPTSGGILINNTGLHGYRASSGGLSAVLKTDGSFYLGQNMTLGSEGSTAKLAFTPTDNKLTIKGAADFDATISTGITTPFGTKTCGLRAQGQAIGAYVLGIDAGLISENNNSTTTLPTMGLVGINKKTTNGIGVLGSSSDDGSMGYDTTFNSNNIGVHGYTNSTDTTSIGVLGVAGDFGYGGYFKSNDGIAVFANVNLGTGNAVQAQTGGTYGFYTPDSAYIGGTVYPFTGSHLFLTKEQYEIGDIIIVDNCFVIDVSQSFGYGSPATVAMDKRVFGVCSRENFEIDDNSLQQACFGDLDAKDSKVKTHSKWSGTVDDMRKDNLKFGSVNSVGEGAINVCDLNGDIQSGDYICSSTMKGKGMKQGDDIMHSYTVAKALESVIWADEPSNTKMIACTYHCG